MSTGTSDGSPVQTNDGSPVHALGWRELGSAAGFNRGFFIFHCLVAKPPTAIAIQPTTHDDSNYTTATTQPPVRQQPIQASSYKDPSQ